MPNLTASLLIAIVKPNIARAIPELGFESPERKRFSCGVSSMTLKNISSDMLDKNSMQADFK